MLFLDETKNTHTNKSKIFIEEISHIKNAKCKDFICKILEKLPNYFFYAPSSSSGKYHNPKDNGHGGLVHHTKAAVKIAISLLNNKSITRFSDIEKDIIISSLILHDGLKYGECEEITNETTTKHEHPLMMGKFLRKEKNEFASKIANGIETHSGQWDTSPYSKVILPKPESPLQRFIHMCDYLASRPFIDVL